ncbi:unnamed protein product [Onchocerca flexuosa]|uniref:Phosphatase PAP2 family protein n=1 Tax=Onchocerca flexuosa TaxID=387005 RepID=A0A183HXK3_9BILA|nr:unnamed protein product [Onchocerca flexuosa]
MTDRNVASTISRSNDGQSDGWMNGSTGRYEHIAAFLRTKAWLFKFVLHVCGHALATDYIAIIVIITTRIMANHHSNSDMITVMMIMMIITWKY